MTFLGLRGLVAASVGAGELARDMDRRLVEIERINAQGATWVQRARIAVAGGDRGSALAMLRAGIARGIPRVPTGTDLHSDPVFAPLRGDPTFQAMIRTGE